MENINELGLTEIQEQGVLFAFMFAAILVLLWFIKYLLSELKTERQVSTQLLFSNTEVIKNNTAVMVRFEDTVRNLNRD